MRHMTRDEYIAALRATAYIKNPTEEQMLSVCPHLTREQALSALMAGKGGYIALPAVRIRHSFRPARYYAGDSERNHAPSFSGGQFGQHTLRSYADGKPQGDVFTNYRYMQESMAYAEDHWPEELILHDWIGLRTVYVQDPTELGEGRLGGPITKFAITVCLNRDSNDIAQDETRPYVQLWDDAITIASVDPIISAELKGGRGVSPHYNCAHCGGGLGLSECSECGSRFPDNGSRTGWSTPLPPKLIKLLRDNGHQFAINPERLLTTS